MSHFVKAFIDNHESVRKGRLSKAGFQITDMIDGKGNGLVILLHGMAIKRQNQDAWASLIPSKGLRGLVRH